MTDSKEIAILYFARSAENDLKKGRFGNSLVHRNIIRQLDLTTLNTIRKTKFPILIFDEHNQVGDDLASRLSHAFNTAFDFGYKAVIAIGNDTPDLKAEHLALAAEALRAKEEILGPSLDGGNYLIGVRSAHFDEEKLKDALTGSKDTHLRLSNLFPSARHLEELRDIDDLLTLENWLHGPFTSNTLQGLKIKIQSLLSTAEKLEIEIRTSRQFCCRKGISFRAPPALI